MSGEGYVGLFVRMLGLDNDPMDREQAVVALWKYSLGGKQYIDEIVQFRGSINLTVNLLKSESSAACEAAAGILRMISTVNEYRDLVAESGAIEEITGLLTRSSLNSDVRYIYLINRFYLQKVYYRYRLYMNRERVLTPSGKGAKYLCIVEFVC